MQIEQAQYVGADWRWSYGNSHAAVDKVMVRIRIWSHNLYSHKLYRSKNMPDPKGFMS